MTDILPSTKLINVFKPIGATPLDVIISLKKKFPFLESQKMGYAGRLDPMAQGVLLIMVGEECKNRDMYQELPKTYEFDLLLGVETDTYDVLGLVVASDFEKSASIKLSEIEEVLSDFKGRFQQEYPPYSSFHVNGKPLFQWAREGKLNEIVIPSKEVEISDISIVSSYKICGDDLLHQFIEDISLVKGDFRQDEIISLWENTLHHNEVPHNLYRIQVSAQSGTYVRSIAKSIGEKLDSHGIAVRINRLSVGDFTAKESISI